MTDTGPATQLGDRDDPAGDDGENPAGTVRDESFVIVATRVSVVGAPIRTAPPPPILGGPLL